MNLTQSIVREYPFAQVLNTPPEADSPAPESRGFFASIVYLWPGSGQRYNTGASRESCKPSSGGVQVPGRSSEQGAKFEHNLKEAIMAAKSLSAPARRKPKSVPPIPSVAASIIKLSVSRRREYAKSQWSDALKIYLGTLNDNDFNIAKNVIRFVAQKPFIDTSRLCEVIPFPIEKRPAAKEA